MKSLAFLMATAAGAKKIDSLPGYTPGENPFDMYSGYVNVNESTGRQVFYFG